MRFGEKLRTLRVRNGFTLQQLADVLGYATRGYISNVEGGDKLPSIDFVVKAARLFQVSTDMLLLDELNIPEATLEAAKSKAESESEVDYSA
jgi:transcriptional regulator with XRE-family HTH domain